MLPSVVGGETRGAPGDCGEGCMEVPVHEGPEDVRELVGAGETT